MDSWNEQLVTTYYLTKECVETKIEYNKQSTSGCYTVWWTILNGVPYNRAFDGYVIAFRSESAMEIICLDNVDSRSNST